MKKYRIRRTLKIGSPDAETDDILFEAFVRNDTLQEIIDTKNQKSILLGRTGSGKSAVIKYIEKNCDNVVRIEPEALSLQYLTNSTILKYFRSLEVNLNLFYKVLWKHVFIVELLKMYFKDDFDKEKKGLWLQNLRDSFLRRIGKLDPKKEKALDYLEKWTDKFWADTEYRIKELENSVSQSFRAALGIKAQFVNSEAELKNEIGEKSLTEVKHKAESIIHEAQSTELIEIFNIMKKDLFDEHQKTFFIVIDDLDREWIETSFRYDLIGAMVEVIKEMRQFKGVKIVISLRENLSELLQLGSRHEGGQREKFKPLYANMKWDEEDLKKLIDKRLKHITDQNLNIKNAFFETRRTNHTGIEYVLQRTFMRPRDVISFINHALENANSKTHFTKDILHKAEVPYSVDRFEALEDEWRENYGEIRPICLFLNGIQDGFRLRALNEDHFSDVYLDDGHEKVFKGNLLEAINDWKKEKINFIVFSKRIIYLLFHIGIIGVKKGPTFPTVFFYDDLAIKKEDISNNNRFYVHPSLYSFFKVITMEQYPED